MSFFQFKWLRKLVRRNMRPIEYTHALAWRDRLSIAYAVVAWNAFGMVCYMVYTGRNDWAKFHGLKTAEDDLMSPGMYGICCIALHGLCLCQMSQPHKQRNSGRKR